MADSTQANMSTTTTRTYEDDDFTGASIISAASDDPLFGRQGNDSDADSSGGLERWNQPRANTYRFGAACFSLFIMGMHDGCIGVSHSSSNPPCVAKHRVR